MIGAANCDAKHRRELRKANELVRRTCTLLRAAVDAGSEIAMENPADRGDPKQPDLFMNPQHAPIWIMPDVLSLEQYADCRKSTFPFCAFGTPYQKQTTLMYTPGLAKGLDDLDLLKCSHDHSKDPKAGGSKVNGIWKISLQDGKMYH